MISEHKLIQVDFFGQSQLTSEAGFQFVHQSYCSSQRGEWGGGGGGREIEREREREVKITS